MGDHLMISAKTIDSCRLCKSTQLKPIFSTGEVYINDFPTTPNGHRGKADMTLVRCDECTLIQLDQTVDSEVYFDYWYQSKLNKKILPSYSTDNFFPIMSDALLIKDKKNKG